MAKKKFYTQDDREKYIQGFVNELHAFWVEERTKELARCSTNYILSNKQSQKVMTQEFFHDKILMLKQEGLIRKHMATEKKERMVKEWHDELGQKMQKWEEYRKERDSKRDLYFHQIYQQRICIMWILFQLKLKISKTIKVNMEEVWYEKTKIFRWRMLRN